MVKKGKKQIIVLLFCVLIISFLWFLCWRYSPFVFQENDDIYLKKLADGSETGTAENKLFFIGIILGTIMSCLYKMSSDVPWYSYILMGSLLISAIVPLFIMMCYIKSKIGKCIGLLIYLFFFYFFFVPQIMNMQFTVIASIACGIGILLICFDEEKNFLYISAFLIFLGLQIRKECAFMALPFAILMWGIRFISEKKRRYLILWGTMIVAIFSLSLIIENFAYVETEWKDFTDFSVMRSELYDYGEIPEYEGNRDVYNKLGISQEERNIINDYNLMFADDIDSNDLAQLAELHVRNSAQEILFTVLEKNMNGNIPLTRIIWMFYFADLILIFMISQNCKYKIKVLIELFSIKMVSIFLWIYVVGKGRFPDRIMVSLFFLECICVIGHLLMHRKDFTIKIKMITMFLLCIGMITIYVLSGGGSYVSSVKTNILYRLEYSTAFNELQKYIEQHKVNFYYIDIDVLNGGFTKKVFEKDVDAFNQAFMGGWLVRSPWYEKKFDNYGLEGSVKDLENENVYLVFKGKNSLAKRNLESFLHEKNFSKTFVTEDVIETKQGTVYEIVGVG